MNEMYEYVDCCMCEGTGGVEPDLCAWCRGDGVVIKKLNQKIAHNPERMKDVIQRVERMFNERIK